MGSLLFTFNSKSKLNACKHDSSIHQKLICNFAHAVYLHLCRFHAIFLQIQTCTNIKNAQDHNRNFHTITDILPCKQLVWNICIYLIWIDLGIHNIIVATCNSNWQWYFVPLLVVQESYHNLINIGYNYCQDFLGFFQCIQIQFLLNFTTK